MSDASPSILPLPHPISQPILHEHRHWVEQLGQRVIECGPGPYIITGGMTTSGPAHMGTLCEMLYPQAILRYLKRLEKPTRYIFIADILDAFDAVPMSMQKYGEVLTPHLGKPLCDVPDPTGEYPSFGDYFLHESLGIAQKFGVEPEIVRAQELYASGAMDGFARLFIEHLPQVRELISTSSLNPNLPPNWSPIMPVCQKCGRISTTRLVDLTTEGYTYCCDKNVKYTHGCGHTGSNAIADHKYKITWRLHWPSWMRHFKTSIEGAGMDHHTRGGSWDSLQAIFKGIFQTEPPIGYQFGFVLFQGKKYSKSKGIGMALSELIQIQPPSVLAFALLRPDLTENRDINPTAENLLRLMNEYEEAGRLAESMGLVRASRPLPPSEVVHQTDAPSSPLTDISRAERKRALAFVLASPHPIWKVSFSDVLIHYSLYGNWDQVASKLGHPEDLAILAPYVQAWEERGLIPEDYRFKFQPAPSSDALVLEWARSLDVGMSALDIHNSIFTLARAREQKPGDLFVKVYQSLIQKPKGPKLGRLVEILGIQRVKDALLGA